MTANSPKFTATGILVLLLIVVSLPVLAGGGHGHGTDTGHTTDGPYEIALETHPEPSAIVPDGDIVETIVSVSHEGASAENVSLSYKLDAPPKRFWFGTDFPIVEGTPLLEGTVPLDDGSQMFELIYPIRGDYTLRATVRGPRGISKKTFTISVSENPREKVNLAIFLLVLFLIGGLGGYFLTAGSTNRPTAALMVLLAIGFFGLQPSAALAHGKGTYNPDKLEQRIGTEGHTDDYNLAVQAFPQPVKVGELLDVSFRLREADDGDHDHGAADRYRADVEFIHTEGGKKFAGQPVAFAGKRADFRIQLFDGAPHFMLTRIYKSAPTGSSDHQEDGHDQHNHGTQEEKSKTEDDDHGHGPAKPWEWQGEVHLASGEYTVEFEEGADPSMKWLLLPAGDEDLNHRAEVKLNTTCRSVEPGTVIGSEPTCYNLSLNEDGTVHELAVGEAGSYRLFTEHVPDEFKMTIRNTDGEPVSVAREFVPGKGELILTDIRKIDVQPVHPPVDDIVKIMLTLIGVAGLGFIGAWRLKVGLG